jgi:hypothetical protein
VYHELAGVICHSILIGDHVSIQYVAANPGCLISLPIPIVPLRSDIAAPLAYDEGELG